MIFLEKRQFDALRHRNRRKIDDQHFRLRAQAHADRVLEFREKIDVGRELHLPDVGPGDNRPVNMDRIAWIRDRARVHRCPSVAELEMRYAFFRADGNDGFIGIRIEVHTVATLVPLADRASQTRNATRNRVAVGIGSLHRLDQFGDDMCRRRTVGIAHTEVDDVLAAATGSHLEFGSDVEDVRGKPRDTRELGDHGLASVVEVHVRCDAALQNAMILA